MSGDRFIERAKELVDRPEFYDAVFEVARDEKMWREAVANPDAFLAERIRHIPEDMVVRPIRDWVPGKPGPDWQPYTIRLTMCRTVVVRDPETRKLQKETFCRGFEVTPNPVPGGPRG